MRWLHRLMLLALAVPAVMVAMSNDESVVLRLVPDGTLLGDMPTLTAPLFAVILAALFVGLLIGTVLEWMRGMGVRRRQRGQLDQA